MHVYALVNSQYFIFQWWITISSHHLFPLYWLWILAGFHSGWKFREESTVLWDEIYMDVLSTHTLGCLGHALQGIFKFSVFWEATLRLIMVFNGAWYLQLFWGRSSNVWEGKLPQLCYNVVVSQHANVPNRMVYGYLVVIPFGKGSHITTVTTTNQTAKRYLSSLHQVHIPPHFVLNPHNAIILGHQVLH